MIKLNQSQKTNVARYPSKMAGNGGVLMIIKFNWSGKKAVGLGFLVLLGIDIYYLFPEIAFYLAAGMTIVLGFSREK